MNFKQQIDELCDYALLHSETPQDFDIHDLLNVTVCLTHVAFSLMWKNSHERNMTAFEISERVESFGIGLRLLLMDATGMDLHETFQNPLDDEILVVDNRSQP